MISIPDKSALTNVSILSKDLCIDKMTHAYHISNVTNFRGEQQQCKMQKLAVHDQVSHAI